MTSPDHIKHLDIISITFRLRKNEKKKEVIGFTGITFTSSPGLTYMNRKNPSKRPAGIPIPKPMIPSKVPKNPIFSDPKRT